MNLWDEKLKTGTLLLVASLFFLQCEDPNELGLELQDDTDKIGTYYQEIELPAYTISRDSVLTSSSARLLSGIYENPDLGKITASSYTQFGFGNEKLDIEEDAVFDSLRLRFRSDYVYGPGIANVQTFTIHELQEDIIDTAAYFNFSEIEYADDSIGSGSFQFTIDEDTLLDFRLTDEFGERLFNAAKDSTVIDPDDGETLLEHFKGLAIISDPGNGTIVRFNHENNDSMVQLFYHQPGDTISKSYDFRFFTTGNFNRYIVDRNNTPLEGIESQPYQEFMPEDNKAYLQSGTGLIPKISVAPVKEFFDSIPHIVLNQASLEIKINPLRDNEYPPSSLSFFYANNENNKRIRSGSQFLGVTFEGSGDLLRANYNRDEELYVVPITVYAEDIIDGTNTFRDILLYPPEFGLSYTFNHFQIDPGNIRFKIYYTKAK